MVRQRSIGLGRSAVGGGWGRAAVAGHPDGAGSERLAGVVRAALPASGSKGDAEARGDCLSAFVTLQWLMTDLNHSISPHAPESYYHSTIFYMTTGMYHLTIS